MNIGFISLGCCKNLTDSEHIMGMLKANGHHMVSDAKLADVIIVNTCGFIESAKEEAINTILEMAEYKAGRCQKLLVMGCLAQRYEKDLIQEIPEIDRVIPIRQYAQLHEIFAELFHEEKTCEFAKSERLLSTQPWTAYLKIAEGCSNDCAYCAIPLIRGGNKSFPIETLLQEARLLANRGVKELVLIAQDTSKYGLDLYGEYKLLDLLKAIHEVEGLHWIRILYMYPDEISDELIEGMAKLPKVIPYFDIPMQHGADTMLERMNRRGNSDDALRLIDKIRQTFDDPTLRTTYIVGFPHESEEEFDQLMKFNQLAQWDRLGAFTYSHEEDTKAYLMGDDVEEAVKEERLSRIMAQQLEILEKKNQDHLGEVMEVLVEGYDALKELYRGRGKNSAPDEVDGWIFFTSEQMLEMGSFVDVVIDGYKAHDLYGKKA